VIKKGKVDYALSYIFGWLRALGYRSVVMRCDNEPAILALLQGVKEACVDIEMVFKNSPHGLPCQWLCRICSEGGEGPGQNSSFRDAEQLRRQCEEFTNECLGEVPFFSNAGAYFFLTEDEYVDPDADDLLHRYKDISESEEETAADKKEDLPPALQLKVNEICRKQLEELNKKSHGDRRTDRCEASGSGGRDREAAWHGAASSSGCGGLSSGSGAARHRW
jgi:hypothetical protein